MNNVVNRFHDVTITQHEFQKYVEDKYSNPRAYIIMRKHKIVKQKLMDHKITHTR